MTLILLALSLALGSPSTERLGPTVSPALGVSDDERLSMARQRIRDWDYEGARILLDQIGLEASEEASYLYGVAWELDRQPRRAIRQYRRTLRQWPDGARSADTRFRIAEAQGTLGHLRKALRHIDALGDLDDYPSDDRTKVQLVEGIFTLQRGRVDEGLALLQGPLTQAGPEVAPFYQAKARAEITRAMLADAAALPITGPEERQIANLDRRAELIGRAEKQITLAALLQQPEWVLEGLLLIGQAYEQVGDDLLDAPAPRALSKDQRGAYKDIIQERVRVVWGKASRYYAQGLDVAERLGWESSRVTALREALAQVEAKRSPP
ncbi:MAG: hypothetical protein JXX28_16215 [Deltaproteobacteria bacterium]|nr:hypothetical protein [Deltaproteobacteria bacterium]